MSTAPTLLPRTARPSEVLRCALEAVERGDAVALATVVARRGSSPATPGQKLALCFDTRTKTAVSAVGTVGGGAVEQAVLQLMLKAAADPSQLPEVHTFKLGATLGMCCGGAADVLIEVLRAGAAVLIVGGGHVGLASAKLLADLGFCVVVADPREAATDQARTEEAREAGVRVVPAEHDDPEVLEALGALPAASALLVMSHDHQLDQRVIEWALRSGFDFVGGVGSRAKAERTRQRLLARGIAHDQAARVRMPVGVAIGARRPLEIAVAIAGELVAWRAQAEGIVRGLDVSASSAEETEPAVPTPRTPVSAVGPLRPAPAAPAAPADAKLAVAPANRARP